MTTLQIIGIAYYVFSYGFCRGYTRDNTIGHLIFRTMFCWVLFPINMGIALREISEK